MNERKEGFTSQAKKKVVYFNTCVCVCVCVCVDFSIVGTWEKLSMCMRVASCCRKKSRSSQYHRRQQIHPLHNISSPVPRRTGSLISYNALGNGWRKKERDNRKWKGSTIFATENEHFFFSDKTCVYFFLGGGLFSTPPQKQNKKMENQKITKTKNNQLVFVSLHGTRSFNSYIKYKKRNKFKINLKIIITTTYYFSI